MLPIRTRNSKIMTLTVNKKRSGEGETKFSGTVSGVVTSSQTDQVVTLVNGDGDAVVAGQIAFKFLSAATIRINDETNEHVFASGDTFSFTDIEVRSFTIKENGVTVDYKGEHF